jgi:hypothetical protein
MSPTFWESKARQVYPYRWWLGATTLLAFLLIGASGMLGGRPFMVASVAIGVPVMVIAWGLFCMSLWFEPSRGTLSANSWLGRHLPPLNMLARWWAAIFLPIFFASGVLGAAWWVFGVLRAA